MSIEKFSRKVLANINESRDITEIKRLRPNYDKGVKNGKCNITGCESITPAIHFNSSTQKYYCTPHAVSINHWSMIDEGINLCDFPTPEELYTNPDYACKLRK